MRNLLCGILGAAALFLSGATLAGPGDHKGPNGGQMRDIGDKHVEVVAKPGQIIVFLFDAKDAKIASTGASGKATVLAKGKTTDISLAPDGDNRLVGKGGFEADKSLAVVVNVSLPGHKPLQGRFTPLR